MQESQAINKKTKTVRETKTIHTRTNIHQTKLKHGYQWRRQTFFSGGGLSPFPLFLSPPSPSLPLSLSPPLPWEGEGKGRGEGRERDSLPPLLPFPPLPLEVGPPYSASGSGERFSSPSGSGRSPAAKRILVHFELKSRHMVATIFRTFLRIN